jgi:hypothetical protein
MTTQAPGAQTRIVEVRCPVGPRQLLMKLRQNGESPHYSEDNLLELACRDCAKNARQVDPAVKRVLHRYAFSGELVESVVER